VRPVALITGAAHGQGRATAAALVADGYDIVAVDVAAPLAYPPYPMGTSAELDELRALCEAGGAACLTAVADVREDAAIGGAVRAAIEPEWDAMLDINLKGAWIVARHVIPHMIEAKRGVIVNNSSVAGLRGMGRLSHYAASKWGLTGLTKSWAIELAPHNIRVVSIHPTGVDTPLNDGLAAMEGKTPQEIAEQSAGNLLPVPWIEASDVAEAVRFLVSDKARYMTGTEFVIDAGLLTR
jgi:NAD(P)-dependent dehydrogenase (short-subunit alcohol dehydrogenase family)